MANPYAPGPLAGGAEALFGALAGGDQIESMAKQKAQIALLTQQSAEQTLDKKITDALLARDKRKAQQSYQANFEANGVAPSTAALISNAMIGGDANLEQAQKFDLRARAEPALAAEGFTPANAILGALAGKPVEGVKLVGGNRIDDIYSDSPTVTPTEAGLATIAATAAQANQRNAAANLSNVKAAAGGFAPERGKDGAGKGTTKKSGARGTLMERAYDLLEAARSDPTLDVTGIDAKQVSDTIKRNGHWTPPKRQTGTVRLIRPGSITNTHAKGNQPASAEPRSRVPAQPKSKAEYDALPSGTRFLAPDGTTRVKP
jgi:hypothetical protein